MRLGQLLLAFTSMFCISFSSCAQRKTSGDVVVAFYNCENFFDTVHNPLKEDEEFTPGGKYHYTTKVYQQKVHNIATVLQSMNDNAGPAIIGLAEVENSTVLKELVSDPELSRHNYKYEWYDGPDPRGINVALIYDPASFRVIKSMPLHVDLSGVSGKSITRDILYVYGVLHDDTVHVFVNHWPSRRGGEDESVPKRAIAAKVVKDAIDRIVGKDPSAKIIVMGDFNDNPDDKSITGVLGAKASQSEVAISGLYDPWADIYKSGSGTEEYKHSWNLFDQVIISGGFLKNTNRKLYYNRAEVYKPDFIIDHYKGHEGEPHRSFVGPHWINGYSDHFPVLLYLSEG